MGTEDCCLWPQVKVRLGVEVEAAGGRIGGSAAADKEAKVQAGKWSRSGFRH